MLNKQIGEKEYMEPEKPQPSDCCNSGCSPCVFDIYEQRLKSWRENQLKEAGATDSLHREDLLSETCFKPFQLINKQQLTEDVFLYRFQPVTKSSVANEVNGFLPYKIGQHFILRCYLDNCNLTNDGTVQVSSSINMSELSQPKTEISTTSSFRLESERIITRAYTPVTLAEQEPHCCFRIFAKLYRNGIASEYLRRLEVGDICYWRGPYGEFRYKPNKFKYILMLCIGSGLAPMISVINYILSNEYDETIVYLMYGVKQIEHVIMRHTLISMTQYWNFTLEYFFSEDKVENSKLKFGESFKNKKIDELSIREYIAGKELQNLLVLVCGTKDFNSYIKYIVSELGVHSENNVFVF